MAKVDELDKAFSALCEVHDKKPSVALIEMYREALLSQLSLEEAVKAIKLSFVQKTFGFPKPGDLIDLFRGKSGDASVEAWRQVQLAVSRAGRNRSILFHDPKITTAIEALGGWQNVCDWPEDDLKWLRKDFMSLYEKCGDGGDVRSLPGLFEIDNSIQGYLAIGPDDSEESVVQKQIAIASSSPVEFGGRPQLEAPQRKRLEVVR